MEATQDSPKLVDASKEPGVEDEKIDLVEPSSGPKTETVGAAAPVATTPGMRRAFLRSTPILGNELCERLAYYGIATNIVIYLTSQLNFSNSSAASSINAWSGTCYVTPLLGAWVADTFAGRYWTIFTFSIIYVIGLTILTISAGLPSLRPPAHQDPTSSQTGVFWAAMYLIALGTGGIKPCVSTFGADQFDESNPEELAMIPRFYNWFYAFINIGSFVASTLLVWIQTDVSWMVGFLIPTGAFAVAITIFVAGTKWYRCMPPGGSPLTRWFRVLAGSFVHWRAKVPEDARLLHEVDTPMSIIPGQTRMVHTPELRFLDKAATVVKGPGEKDRWLVTVTEVEEFKCVVRLIPFMLILAIYWAIYNQMSTLFVLQGNAMNRYLGSWSVPAAMVNVLDNISVLIWVPLYDLVIAPYFEKIGYPISRLTRMGIGFVVAIISMVCAAAVEIVRLQVVSRHNLQNVDPTDNSVPMSVWWQIPQYFFVGMSEVFASVGSLEFFYSQSPEAMRSVASALNLVSTAIGAYLATALVAIVQAITNNNGSPGWIANNLNQGHIDYFYWLLAVLMFLGILAYIPVCYTYRYRQDPSIGFDLANAADLEKLSQRLGRASVGVQLNKQSLARMSSAISTNRGVRRISAAFPVHAGDMAMGSLAFKEE